MSTRHARLLLLPVAAALAAAGCAQQTTTASKFDTTSGDSQFGAEPSAEFNLPPRELMARIVQVLPGLGLPVARQTKDTVLTGWERHVGDFHILRHWQERTRYRLTVIPDSDDPTGRSRLLVDEETQQRAASVQEFENASYLHRPQRARQLLAKIEQQIPPAAPGTARRTVSTPPRQPAQPAPAVTIGSADARYTPFADNAELAVLRTDPNTGATQAILRATAAEARVPAHALTTGTSFTVISGAATITVKDTPTVLSPLGFTYVPPGSKAQLTLTPHTQILVTTDGPWDPTWGK